VRWPAPTSSGSPWSAGGRPSGRSLPSSSLPGRSTHAEGCQHVDRGRAASSDAAIPSRRKQMGSRQQHGWQRQGTPSQLNTLHFTPPQAPCSDKSITARHKSKASYGERAARVDTAANGAANSPAHSSPSEVGTSDLTPDVVLSAVQHVGSMDELVAGATHPQLRLGVAQNDLPPAGDRECTQLRGGAGVGHHPGRVQAGVLEAHSITPEIGSAAYLASHAKGVKSSLCFVLKIMFLVRICRMDGSCKGVEIAKRASWGGSADPSSDLLLCP